MNFLDTDSHRDEKGIAYYFGKDFEGIKKSATLQKEIRDKLVESIKPGITTNKINNLALRLIREAGAEPLFLGYRGFPSAICISVNSEVVHGTASKLKLKKGDVVSLDLGVKLNGYCGDSCRTVIVGNCPRTEFDKEIVDVAERSFQKGLEQALPGRTIGDVGHAVYTEILSPKNQNGHSIFDIYKDFMGHGIGLNLHEKPHVPNYGFSGHGHLLKPGMCICIEPVVIPAGSDVVRTRDIFTFITSDGRTASHYENQIYISDTGPIVLT